jgi:hypothetical protein
MIFKSQAAIYNIKKRHDKSGRGNKVPMLAAHEEEAP